MTDYVYPVIFVIALASPFLFLIFFFWKKWLRTGIIVFSVYAMTYVILSLGGKYTTANNGGNDWTKEWCPKGLVYEYTSPAGRSKTNFTIAGAAFWPCIIIDRLAWHRTTEAVV